MWSVNPNLSRRRLWTSQVPDWTSLAVLEDSGKEKRTQREDLHFDEIEAVLAQLAGSEDHSGSTDWRGSRRQGMRCPGSHTSPVYTGVGPGENHRAAVS